MEGLFKTARTLEAKVQEFCEKLSEGALIFKSGIEDYLDGEMEQFAKRLKQAQENEKAADELRREIRFKLYTKMLIPESRGDVLGLLETSDSVIDATKKVLAKIDIERPNFRENTHVKLRKLADKSSACVSNLASANLAFFTNKGIVQDYIHALYFYEAEVDDLEEDLKRMIFRDGDIPRLSERMLLRDLVGAVAALSDMAEDVGERVSVYSIKRSI